MFFSPSSTFNRNARLIASNIVWICVIAYFLYHIVIGARGAISWAILSREINLLEKDLRTLKENNAFIEHKISLLRDDNLDLDLLEEQARQILGMSNDGDCIVLLPREPINNIDKTTLIKTQ